MELSPRDKEYLHYLACDCKDPEIAEKMGITMGTVLGTYRTRAGRILGLKSRKAIVEYAKSQGYKEYTP